MTKYHMYKKEKEITDVDVFYDVLKKGTFAIIALSENDRPYIVTMNYGYDEGKNALYFHCALKGLKLNILSQNPNVCATVLEDLGYKADECSHAYRTIVFRGTLCVVRELEEKKYGMEVLFHHLEANPDPIRERNFKTEGDYSKVNILRLDIEEITGKQGQ